MSEDDKQKTPEELEQEAYDEMLRDVDQAQQEALKKYIAKIELINGTDYPDPDRQSQ